ncbi:MAG: hypothetical protein ACRBBK_13160 [Paracoccaceae bacterium]
MIRPELRHFLNRWREALFGAGLVALGLWMALIALPGIALLGYVIALLGGAVVFTGLRKGRLYPDGFPREDAAGMVELVERELRYLTSQGGQSFSLDDVAAIQIETNDLGPFLEDRFWIITLRGQGQIRIGASAAGSEALIDALASFDGADYGQVLAANLSTDNAIFTVWRERPNAFTQDKPRALH